MTKYVEFSDDHWTSVGPTQTVADLVATITQSCDGRDVIDGGQGSELALEHDDPLYRALTKGGLTLETGEYHTDSGGSLIASAQEIRAVRDKTAGYVKDFYRLPAQQKNIFLLQTLGRTAVDFSMREMARPHVNRLIHGTTERYKPVLGIAREHWGNLSKLAYDNNLGIATFDNRNSDPADAIIAFLGNHDPQQIAGVLLTYPLNPTSQTISCDAMQRVVQKVSEMNTQTNVDIHLLFDAPYAFGCEFIEDGHGAFLDTGMQGVLDDVDNVHWSVAISTSKLLSMAKAGHTILVVDQKRQEEIASRLATQGTGLARLNDLSRNVADLLGGDGQEILRHRKDALRAKYQEDDLLFSSAFGDAAVPGGANSMLRVAEFPLDDLFGHAVTCCDGQERVLVNEFDVVTFLANDFQVAVVPSGKIGGKGQLRFAKREAPQRFKKLVEGVAEGLEVIRSAPVAEPAVGPAAVSA